jgi:hypothetical protein
MEHLNDILFHKSGPANKEHTTHSLKRDENGEWRRLHNEEINSAFT